MMVTLHRLWIISSLLYFLTNLQLVGSCGYAPHPVAFQATAFTKLAYNPSTGVD